MFEKGTRLRIRFPHKGLNGARIEDLWLLSDNILRGMYKGLYKELRETQEEDDLFNTKKQDTVLELKVAILKHIILVKIAEAKAKEREVFDKQHDQKILGMIQQIEDEKSLKKSIPELRAMLSTNKQEEEKAGDTTV